MKKDELKNTPSSEGSGLPPRPAADASREEWRAYALYMQAVAAASEQRANSLHETLNRIITSSAWRLLKSAHGLLHAPFRSTRAGKALKSSTAPYVAKVAGSPLVSILIPFRDQAALLAQCLRSIRQKSTYKNVEFVLIDNGSDQKSTRELLKKESANAGVKIVRIDEPFNFSRLINAGAAVASGDHLLLLNNDIEVLAPGWLEAMLELSCDATVGAVGAKLLYPDGRIQHAGVVFGSSDIASHVCRLAPGDDPCCNAIREFPAVTGACLLTRRDVFENLGGLDEKNLPVAYNDVDYCLRAREQGLRVVYTPHAVLIHHESATRSRANDPREAAYMCRRWARELIDQKNTV